ncbi:MAG TPA: helix-hairpin-helix domain-containing protein [Rhizomicrobium sp.]|nr:helix-hairpin-helix domain-containing protein [Rhizomicrobium sp.]
MAAVLACAILPALAAPGDLEALTKASDLDPDPADAQAVATVCTACHSSAQFLTAARPYLRWEQTMQDMLDRGAVATDEQLDHVLSYLVKNITIVNVNSSPPDQLGMTLQIPSAVADDIVARRTAHPFTNVDELKAVKGVNPEVVRKLAAKKLIAF